MKIIMLTFAAFLISSCSNDSSGSNTNRPIIDTPTLKKAPRKNVAPINTKTMHGLIKEDGGLREVYYANGKKDGIFKSYYKKNGTLQGLGFYKDDKPVGTWYYFNQNSEIIMIEEKQGINKDKQIKRDDGTMIKPQYISYLKEYDPKSGRLKKEGLALYFDDIEIDYYRYGKWKEYGNLSK